MSTSTLRRGAAILLCIVGALAAVAITTSGRRGAEAGGTSIELEGVPVGQSNVHSAERMEETELRVRLKRERSAMKREMESHDESVQKLASSKAASSLAKYDVISFGDDSGGGGGGGGGEGKAGKRRPHPTMASMEARLKEWEAAKQQRQQQQQPQEGVVMRAGGAGGATPLANAPLHQLAASPPSGLATAGSTAPSAAASSVPAVSTAAANYLSQLLGSLKGKSGGSDALGDVLRGDIAGLEAFEPAPGLNPKP
jgi:hypothetical protein